MQSNCNRREVRLAEICRTAFRKYVAVARQGPEPDGKRYRAQARQGAPQQRRILAAARDHAVDIGHAFKYPCSCYDLLQHANDPALQREWEAKEFHVF